MNSCWIHDFSNPTMHEQPTVSTTPRSLIITHAVYLAWLTLWLGSIADFRNTKSLCFLNSTLPILLLCTLLYASVLVQFLLVNWIWKTQSNYVDVASCHLPAQWEVTGEASLQNCHCDFLKPPFCVSAVSTSDFRPFVLKADCYSDHDSHTSLNTVQPEEKKRLLLWIMGKVAKSGKRWIVQHFRTYV